MYQVPSEFMRQKATVVWFVTVEHAVAAFAGYLLGHFIGGGALLTLACMGLGVALVAVQVQGLALYRFVPLAVAYLVRKVSGDTVEPEEGPVPVAQGALILRDEDGQPIVYGEQ